MRGLIEDFRTMDWVEVRENLRFTASKLKYLRDIMGEQIVIFSYPLQTNFPAAGLDIVFCLYLCSRQKYLP